MPMSGSEDERIEVIIRRWEASEADWSFNEILRQADGNQQLATLVQQRINAIEGVESEFDLRLRDACDIERLSPPSASDSSSSDTDDSKFSTQIFSEVPARSDSRKVASALSSGFGEKEHYPWKDDAVLLENKFQHLRRLDRGGLSTIEIFHDDRLNREVAFKLLNRSRIDNPEHLKLFWQEAEITAKLDHPGVPPVLGAGTLDNGQPYFVMRLVRGSSYRQCIEEFHHDIAAGKFQDQRHFESTFRRLLSQFVAICRVMEYAHDRGVVHGDLKPANVRVGRFGEVVVLDWGMAALVRRSESEGNRELSTLFLGPRGDQETSGINVTGGTIAYMSPEVWNGLNPRFSSDIYALGVMLYELLVGKRPVCPDEICEEQRIRDVGQSAGGKQGKKSALRVPEIVAERVCAADYPDVASVMLPNLQRMPGAQDLCAIVRSAMLINRAERYRTTGIMADDLESMLGDRGVSVRRSSLTTRVLRLVRRHKSVAAAVLLAGCAAIVSFLLISSSRLKAARETASAQNAVALAAAAAASDRDLALQSLADFAAMSVVNEIALRSDAVGTLANDSRIPSLLSDRTSEEANNLELRQWLSEVSQIQSVQHEGIVWWVLDERGVLRASTRASDELGGEFSHMDLFHGRGRPLQPGSPASVLRNNYVSTVWRNPVNDQLQMAITHPIIQSGDVFGVVAMLMSLDKLTALQLNRTDKSIHVALVDLRGCEIDQQVCTGIVLDHSREDPSLIGSGDRSSLRLVPVELLDIAKADLHHSRPVCALPDAIGKPLTRFTATTLVPWERMSQNNGWAMDDLPEWRIFVQR